MEIWECARTRIGMFRRLRLSGRWGWGGNGNDVDDAPFQMAKAIYLN